VKFLIDAHLPPELCRRFARRGHDAIHTSSLPRGNATTDAEVRSIATAESRVVVTKDIDFFNELVLYGPPPKLVLVRCGNVGRADLLALFEARLDAVVLALESNDLVELAAEPKIH